MFGRHGLFEEANGLRRGRMGACTRRTFTASSLALLAGISSPIPASASNYPNHTVRILIPFSAGGGADVLLRIVANGLAERWKQSVVVENRAGGNTVIGTLAAV